MLLEQVAAQAPLSLIATQGSLSSWLLEDHLFVAEFSRRNFRIYNPAAAALWLLLLDRDSSQQTVTNTYAQLFGLTSEVAQQDVMHCLSEWQSLGWLAMDQDANWRVASQRPSTQPAETVITANQFPTHATLSDQLFQLSDTKFRVRIGETCPMGASGLAARLVAMLRGFPLATSDEPVETLEVIVAPDATYMRVTSQAISVWCDPVDALSHTIQAIFLLAYPGSSIVSTLHAAAIGKQSALLLSGVSGAGKSTLAAHLASRNWRYYGDDIVGLTANGDILPLPTAISLKEGSWLDLFGSYPELPSLETISYGAKMARYLPISSAYDIDANARKLAGWIFPHYQAKIATQFEEVTVIEAVQNLIEGGMAIDQGIDRQGMHAILDLLIRLPKYRLIYSILDEAEACLATLITN